MMFLAHFIELLNPYKNNRSSDAICMVLLYEIASVYKRLITSTGGLSAKFWVGCATHSFKLALLARPIFVKMTTLG